MSRKFTVKENILLLICACLFLGIFYYQAVWKSTAKMMETYNVINLEDELLAVQLKAQKLVQMQKVLKENDGQSGGLLLDYNNLENEITEINSILSKAKTFNLNFDNATTDGSIVRRNINITFTTGDYDTAKEMIQSLKNCKYKCLIRDVNLSATEGGLQTSKNINVSLQVTFFEGVSDSVSSAGLQEIKPEN